MKLPRRWPAALGIALIILTTTLPGAASAHRASARSSIAAPVFTFPSEGTVYPSSGPYLFKVQPVSGATGYLWAFVQGGAIVYQNLDSEGHLSPASYTIAVNSAAHGAIRPGSLQVRVRALMGDGTWSDGGVLMVTIQGKAAATTGTANPAGSKILYQADWSHGFNGWPKTAGWSILNGMVVTDDTVHGNLPAPYQPGSARIANYAVQAEIQLVRGDNFGLVTRWDSGDGIYGGAYKVSILNGAASIYVGSTPLAVSPQPFAPGTTWHTYRAEARGNHIIVLIDGKPYVNLTDNSFLTGGGVGIYCWGAQIEVRNFKVIAL